MSSSAYQHKAWKMAVKVAEVTMEVFRYVWSTSLLLFSLGIIIYGMVFNVTTFYAGTPSAVQIILLFVLLALLGTMEGTMIALTQLRKVDPATYKDKYKLAYNTAQFAFQGERIERFLNGRQVVVVLCGFQLAYLTTIAPGGLPFLPYFLQQLLETGLLGSFIVLILGQITPQIFAAKFPMTFLSIPFLPIVFRVCLAIEFTGLTYATWAIVRSIIFITGHKFKADVKEPEAEEPAEEEKQHEQLALFANLQALTATDANADVGVQLDVLNTDQVAELPILVGNEQLYASKQAIADGLDQAGIWGLSYLLPEKDVNYVPAHIVAAALTAENARLHALLAQAAAAV